MEDTRRISNQNKKNEQSIENLRKAMLGLTSNQKEIQDTINSQINNTSKLIKNQNILELYEIGNKYKIRFIEYLFLSSIFIMAVKDIELSILLIINFIIFFIGIKITDKKIFNEIEKLKLNNKNKGDDN